MSRYVPRTNQRSDSLVSSGMNAHESTITTNALPSRNLVAGWILGNSRDTSVVQIHTAGLTPSQVRSAIGWGGIGNDDAEALVYRLGNMTLLHAGANRDLGTADYAQKRSTYQQSGFVVTKKLGDDNADWTPERIAARQNWMATQATTIWRIAQLS